MLEILAFALGAVNFVLLSAHFLYHWKQGDEAGPLTTPPLPVASEIMRPVLPPKPLQRRIRTLPLRPQTEQFVPPTETNATVPTPPSTSPSTPEERNLARIQSRRA